MNSNIDKISLKFCLRRECEYYALYALSCCRIKRCCKINHGGMNCRQYKKANKAKRKRKEIESIVIHNNGRKSGQRTLFKRTLFAGNKQEESREQ